MNYWLGVVFLDVVDSFLDEQQRDGDRRNEAEQEWEKRMQKEKEKKNVKREKKIRREKIERKRVHPKWKKEICYSIDIVDQNDTRDKDKSNPSIDEDFTVNSVP